ncbi:MAG: mechanosensitive ion channel [Rhodothermales bacterium]
MAFDEIIAWIEQNLGEGTVGTLAQVVLIFIGTIVLMRIGRRLVDRFVADPSRRYQAGRTVRTTSLIIGFLLIVLTLAPDTDGFLSFFTVIGAGLAIALREVLLSVAGWIKLSVMNTYKIGDRIEINGVKGDVLDIRVLRTTMMEVGGWVGADQSTGRLVHVPNSWVFSEACYNYTRGFSFVWHEMSVVVTFQSDYEAARQILLDLAEPTTEAAEQEAAKALTSISSQYLIHYSIMTPFVYVDVVENGVRLTLRFLSEVRKRRGMQHAITLSLLKAFEEHERIELAYPMLGISSYDSSNPKESIRQDNSLPSV